MTIFCGEEEFGILFVRYLIRVQGIFDWGIFGWEIFNFEIFDCGIFDWGLVEIPDWVPKVLAGYTYCCPQHEKSTGCLVEKKICKIWEFGTSSGIVFV